MIVRTLDNCMARLLAYNPKAQEVLPEIRACITSKKCCGGKVRTDIDEKRIKRIVQHASAPALKEIKRILNVDMIRVVARVGVAGTVETMI